ncbi:hypothetical protein ES702_04975 [subsurface metagenome]
MPLGKENPSELIEPEKMLANTTRKARKADKANITDNVNNVGSTYKPGHPSANPETATYNTTKKTFYVRENLFEKLSNFAWWERLSITDAINKVLEDGLKGKKTKKREK